MRHLTREKAQGWRLLDRARTIAVVGPPPTASRHRATLAYLRRAGYDVRPVRTASLSKLGGSVDLLLVFGTLQEASDLLRDAAAKRADGVWFIGAGPDRAARMLAQELGLVVVHDPDIVSRHQERLREAGQPRKLGVRPRRRGRPDTGALSRSRPGWTEAGGGGQRGGGGGRAAVDEKKMIRRRRSRTAGRRAAA